MVRTYFKLKFRGAQHKAVQPLTRLRTVQAQSLTPYTYTYTMGLLLSLPLAGVFGTIGSSCLAGLAFFCTSTAGKLFVYLLAPAAADALAFVSLDVLQVVQLQLFYCHSRGICGMSEYFLHRSRIDSVWLP